MAVPLKIKRELPYDPIIPLLGLCPEELKARSWRNIGMPAFKAT